MPARAARLLFQLPSDCRVFSALYPANKWGWSEVLQNKANYLLEVLAWQKANEGVKQSKQTEKPKLFMPDFMKEKVVQKDIEIHTTEDIREILNRPRA